MASVALILKESSQLLEKVSGQNAKREAKILLEFTFDLKGKILQLDHEISDDIYNYFKTLINKRLEFQPISQIIGERYFWKNKFIVSPNELKPVPTINFSLYLLLDKSFNSSIFSDTDISCACPVLPNIATP